MLAPGGRLVLADLHRWTLWAAWRRLRGLFGFRTWRIALFRSVRGLARFTSRAGLVVTRTSEGVYYPPVGWLAWPLSPLDRAFRAVAMLGATFIVVVAERPLPDRQAGAAERG